jgi:hypothetical protein
MQSPLLKKASMRMNSLADFAHRSHLWDDFNGALSALYRRDELDSLIKWAARKKLPAQQQFYTTRLIDEETRLTRYAHRSPRVFFWARVARWVNALITPPTRYYKGYAAKYRTTNFD